MPCPLTLRLSPSKAGTTPFWPQISTRVESATRETLGARRSGVWSSEARIMAAFGAPGAGGSVSVPVRAGGGAGQVIGRARVGCDMGAAMALTIVVLAAETEPRPSI